MHKLIQDIANRWPAGPDREVHVAAAATFRIPYWDWAQRQQPDGAILPTSFSGLRGIQVRGPAGSQVIRNPLYSYRFRPLDTTALVHWPVRCSSSSLAWLTC